MSGARILAFALAMTGLAGVGALRAEAQQSVDDTPDTRSSLLGGQVDTSQQQAGGSGVVDVVVSESGGGMGLSVSSTGGQVCVYRPFLADPVVGEVAPAEAPFRLVGGVREELWIAMCPGGDRLYWQSILSEAQLLDDLLDRARGVVPEPVPEFWPFETLTRWTWVRWPSYVWLDPAQTVPRVVSASTPGISVSAVVTASAMRVDLGDGQKLDCPGVTRRPSDAEILGEAGTSAVGACSFEYPRSSFGQPNDKYQARVDVVWRIAWTSTTGASGVFPAMTTSAPVEIAVGKIQAINN